ncbi:MAG: bifunctional nicotinamidase/pyrazinamidase [Flavobacteriaceae bacterium]|jgi:nicotinamidase/pyrazinamidase|nr:bifunctional nicotinamidase/pyrazinamidase [Flavobacteriaceae bacterium]
MKALLVVDLQNDFLPNGALAVANGDEIIPIINDIQQQFDLVIATQDWHPYNHKSFARQHPSNEVFDVIDLNGVSQVLWPDHCVQGTEGAEFSKMWNSNEVVAIFRKGINVEIDSYSGFYDNNKQANTGLLGFLKEKQVTQLYVCGLAADFCVYYTAKDAVETGFNTYFLEFATKAISPEGLVNAKQELIKIGVEIVQTKEDLQK